MLYFCLIAERLFDIAIGQILYLVKSVIPHFDDKDDFFHSTQCSNNVILVRTRFEYALFLLNYLSKAGIQVTSYSYTLPKTKLRIVFAFFLIKQPLVCLHYVGPSTVHLLIMDPLIMVPLV